MKKIWIAFTLIIALVSIACQSTHIAASVSPHIEKPNLDLIKNSTLLFVVESIQSTGVALGYGMGTLVQYQGELFMVSHNHWGVMLQDTNIVEIRDAQGKMIRQMYASEFKNLIIYQDAGTMVLRAPDGLADSLTPARLDGAIHLKKGDIVQVAHRNYPNRDKVEILDAVVEDISVFMGEPVYTLRTPDGQTLHPGDSGGGVWHNGKLIANTWTVLATYSNIDAAGNLDPASETLTNLGHAAIIPDRFK